MQPDPATAARARRPTTARVVLVLLVVTATVVLAVPAVHAVRESWHASESRSALAVGARAAADGFACAAAAVRDQVPPGTAAYIREPQPGPYGELWYQRLVEMTYPYATVVADRAEADVEVEILEVPADQGCGGAQVHVRSLR